MLRRIILLAAIVVAVLMVAALAAVVLIDPDDHRERIAERASAQIGREVTLDGPIDLKLFPWLSFEVRDASVANPQDFEDAPALAEIGLATASIRLWPLLRREIEIGAIEFENATFHLVTDRAGRSNLDGLFAAEPEPGVDRRPADLGGLETGPLRLRNVVVALLDLASGERTDIAIDSLDADPFAPGREVVFSLRGRVNQDGESVLADVRFDGRLNVPADISGVVVDDWSARFELPGAQASGRAEGDVRIDLAQIAPSLEMSRLRAGLEFPGLAMALEAIEPIVLTLGDPPELSMPSAIFELDDQRLSVAGGLRLAERLDGRLDITGERLDLRQLTGIGGGETVAGDADAEADFRPLRMLDLRSTLQLEELTLAEGMRLEDVDAEARLREGLLMLEPMRARLFGGHFDGSARVDFNQEPPAVRLQPRLSGVLVEELAGLVSDFSPVAGSGDLALDIRFQGMALADILGSLGGTGQFSVRDGAIRGIDLNRLIEQELAVSSLADVRQVFSGETPFRQLDGSMRIDDGVLVLPNLDLSAAGFGARGSGQFDFAANQVDYRLELDLGERLLEQLPQRLRTATGGRIPLVITGPVSAPVVAVDLAGIAERAVRDELGRRLFDRLGPRESGEQPPPDDDERGSDAEEEPAGEPDRRERTSRQLLRGLLERDVEEESVSPEDEDDPEPPY